MGVFHEYDDANISEMASRAETVRRTGLISRVLKRSGVNQLQQIQSRLQELEGINDAVNRSQAVVEFAPSGSIVSANQNFLSLTGYRIDELIGQHHQIFVADSDKGASDYHKFWLDLGRGEYRSGEFMRVGKNGEELWVRAIYKPIFNAAGEVVKVVKHATDITDQKNQEIDNAARIDAIERSQGVIEFTPEGVILRANDNFLKVMGYSLEEIKGKHHRIFMSGNKAGTPEYAEFWKQLASGEFQSGEFKRIGKSGNEVWINATYTPVLNASGKVVKVIKFASDITESKLKDADNTGKVEAINKSQAIIEFSLDGTILTANDNFLNTLGYTLSEVKGQHHSMFVEKEYKDSVDYKEFWQKLNRGEFDSGEYRRIGKGGRPVWIQATYNPVLDAEGKIAKVVKFAIDITEQKNLNEMIANTMADTSKVMNALSEGNLTVKMEGEYSGEFVQLANNINNYIDTLVSIVCNIKESAFGVRVGAGEIAHGNLNLSQRTEEQAASLEEASSAMEELTTTVQSNTENSAQANCLAKGASEVAEKGGAVVGEAMAAMQEIHDSSTRIGAIISVIDEIAFQTNLLALNAAVEAARAGDQGKGFAVVADEVRELAGRSAKAAKEIKSLIEDSHGKVSKGSQLINGSGDNLNEIVDAVKKVNLIVSEITASSAEQATGLTEINRSVQEMDQMTQQNAALVEQAAAASDALDSQAEKLESLVSFFYLHEAH